MLIYEEDLNGAFADTDGSEARVGTRGSRNLSLDWATAPCGRTVRVNVKYQTDVWAASF